MECSCQEKFGEYCRALRLMLFDNTIMKTPVYGYRRLDTEMSKYQD